MTTLHPTADDVITPFDAAVDFGIVADGVKDVTGEIQTARVMIGNLGGSETLVAVRCSRLRATTRWRAT